MKREILGDAAIITAGALLLVIGVSEQLRFPQGYYGVEPNLFILWVEVAMSLGITILGIERAINDRGCGVREAAGDAVMIMCGVTLSGMFVTIVAKGEFLMGTVETWFIIMRFIIATVIIGLGIERFLNDTRP